MRPVSPEFLRILRGSHRMCARARLVAPGQTGVDPDGIEIPILGGDVQYDAAAKVRATLDLTTDPAQWPVKTSSLLTPYGGEVFVERGVVFGNGDRVWVSQGYYRIGSVEQDNAPRGAIDVSAGDRMTGLIDARLLAPIQFSTGASVAGIFGWLVQDVYPSAEIVFDFDADNTTLTSPHIAEQDRYAFLLDIATSLGKVMYWDHEGRLRVQDAPDPGDPVWDVTHGEQGVLVELSRTLTRDKVYNAVVATGETPGETEPVRAVAWDDNPQSPTYWSGPFGKVPRFYSSPFVKTQEQARSTAAAMLQRVIGLPYSVEFDAVVNPALEPLDPVRVSYTDSRAPETHVLQSLTIPLVADDGMSAKTREQTTVKIGVN